MTTHNKKPCTDDIFTKRIIPTIVTRHQFYSASYYKEPFDTPLLQMYYLSKEQIAYIFEFLDRAGREVLFSIDSAKTKDGKMTFEYDMTDSVWQIVNFCAGIIRDSIEDNVLSKDEAFEYYKETLKRFINYHKFCILENIEYYKTYYKPNQYLHDISWRRTEIFEENWYSERYYDTLPKMAFDYFNEEKYNKEIEKIIEKDIEMFCMYKATYNTGFNSEVYLLKTFQEIFPFSDGFVKRNYKYFWIPFLIKNKNCTQTKDQLDFIFKNILEWNIAEITRMSSCEADIEPIKISKEKVDELVLLFAAN